MKTMKLHIRLFATMLLVALGQLCANAATLGPDEVEAYDKSEVTIPITLSGEIYNTIAFQMDIAIPDGLTLVDIALGSRAEAFTMGINEVSDGVYRVVAYNTQNQSLSGSGSIVDVTLQCGDAPNAYQVEVSNVKITTENLEEESVPDLSITVNVNEIIVTAVYVDIKSLDLLIGETAQLTATVEPENATNTTITWRSSDESVATVDQNGLVTAVGSGTAVITASCGGQSATCVVTVSIIEVESITLSAISLDLVEGETAQLTATVLPENAYETTVTWTSSNSAIATVDQDGLVTAVGQGSTLITASCGGQSATCSVNVSPYFPDIYVRGDMNYWEAVDDWKMTTTDGITYILGNFTLEAGVSFKLGSADWSEENWGYTGDEDLKFETEYVLLENGSNMKLAESAEGATMIFNRETHVFQITNGAFMSVWPTVGEAGATVDFPIGIWNTEYEIVGFQMDVTLPAEVSLTDMTLGARAEGYNLNYSQVEENHYRLAAYHNQNQPIADTQGEVVVLKLTLSDAVGEYWMYVTDVEVTDADGNAHALEAIGTTITIVAAGTCPTPWINYDGRYIVIISDETYNLHVALDDEEVDYSGGAMDIYGAKNIKAWTTLSGYNDSEIVSYDVPAYFDGEVATVNTPGGLSKGVQWAQNLDILDELVTIEVKGTINDDDAELIGSLQSLGSIKWNCEDYAVPDGLFDSNQNILVYVADANMAGNVRNVVVNGNATEITLDDSGNFYVPEAFEAQNISYVHHYSMETAINGDTQGWESITLPFVPELIMHEDGSELRPFAALPEGDYSEAKPFWLYEMSDSGWVAVDEIAANTPYLISIPNNKYYAAEYQLVGDVTFSASSAPLRTTSSRAASWNGYNFVPTTLRVEASDAVAPINRLEWYRDYAEGSAFVPGLRDVEPFEAYLTAANGSRMNAPVRISEIGDTNSLPFEARIGDDADWRVWTQDGVLYIASGAAQRVTVYNAQGMAVRVVTVEPGVNEVQGLAPAIYLVRNAKVIVK